MLELFADLFKSYCELVQTIDNFMINDYTPWVYGGFVFVAVIVSSFFVLKDQTYNVGDDLAGAYVACVLIPLGIFAAINALLIVGPIALTIMTPIIIARILLAIYRLFEKEKGPDKPSLL